MSDGASGKTRGQVLRFLVVGGMNTVLTGAIFLGLSSVTASSLAYTIAFAVGIAFAIIGTPRLVFRARASRTQRVRYMGWYVAVYFVGLGLVYVLHDRLLLGNLVVAAVTFLVTAGLSFLGARFLFEQGSRDAAGATDH